MADRQRVDYHRYMASREWALKKKAVKERSGGLCERCRNAPMTQTHHLTYEHLGNEPLDDLLGLCRPCHEYQSGVTDVDPATEAWLPEMLRQFAEEFGPEVTPEWCRKVQKAGFENFQDFLTPTMRSYAAGYEAGYEEGYKDGSEEPCANCPDEGE